MSVVQGNPAASQVADKKKNLIEKYFPRAWPYFRLMRSDDRCVITTFLPFSWGLLLAANVSSFSPAYIVLYLVVFVVSTFLWVGAAAIVNDLWDRDFDKQVARCKARPIATGEISVPKAIICFIAVQMACLVPTYNMNETCQKLFLLVILPIALYPCTKRLMGIPSIAFGAIVNWGLLIGWASVTNNVDAAVCGPLYFGAVCSTLFYDTIYGAQDTKDDTIAGVKSTYLTFGPYTKILLAFSVLGTIAGFSLAGANAGMEWPYYVGMLVCTLDLGQQTIAINLDDPEDCTRMFDKQLNFTVYVSLSILAGAWNIFQGSAPSANAWHEL